MIGFVVGSDPKKKQNNNFEYKVIQSHNIV